MTIFLPKRSDIILAEQVSRSSRSRCPYSRDPVMYIYIVVLIVDPIINIIIKTCDDNKKIIIDTDIFFLHPAHDS